MTLALRLFLVVCAIGSFAFIIRKIRKSEATIADSTFWFLFGLALVVLAIFPEIAFFFARALGFESAANFVFLCVIALLLIKEFSTTSELSRVRSKLAFLTQEVALAGLDERVDERLAAKTAEERSAVSASSENR